MEVNVQKTKLMVFEKSRLQTTVQTHYQGQRLKQEREYKYLGTFFTSNMNFKTALEKTLEKARKGASAFWKYTSRFSNMKISGHIR